MAAITAKAVTGNFSVATNWVGDVAPAAGDTVIIPSGATITVDAETPVLGSNAAAVGYGVHVQSGGILLVGATLNANGYDTGSNKAIYVAPGGTLQRSTGGNIVVTPVSSWQTIILNEGDFLWNGGEIKSGEPWTFASRGMTLTGATAPVFKKTPFGTIRIIPIGNATTGSLTGSGPVSNASESAVGTALDNSFEVVSVTGGTYTPANILQSKVSDIDELLDTGDYYVDCNNGALYYLDTEDKAQITCTYTVKTHRFFGFGIASTRNGDSRFLLENAVLERMGGNFGPHNTLYGEQAVLLRYRTSVGINPAREGRVNGCTFRYCLTSITAANFTCTQSNPLDLTGNTILYEPMHGGNYYGCFHFQYAAWADISGTHYDTLQSTCGRTSFGLDGLIMRNCTGRAKSEGLLPITGCTNGIAEDNIMESIGGLGDGGGFEGAGSSAAPNAFRRNKISYGCRMGRIRGGMIVEDNELIHYEHHGFIGPSSNGYFSGIKIKRNVARGHYKKGMSGGWTLGYNYTQWLDDVEIEGNTFDDGSRGINFNDQEGTRVLGTRLKIWNNNITRNTRGIYRPNNDVLNISRLQIERLDYNNVHGNTNSDNITQATFVRGGTEYNLDASRNVLGVSLFSPSAPVLTEKTLQLVVTGTPGVDLSMLLSWGGGTTVELVKTQGTATGGTAATGSNAANVPGTLVDSAKSWTTNEHLLRQGKIVSGTGSGQIFSPRSNTATVLTVTSGREDNTFVAPSTDSVYVVVDSEVQLSDGTNTVQAGIHVAYIPMAAGTYADAGITTESNALAVDPQYVSATDLTPTNTALATAGFGGTYIGAVQPVNPDETAPVLTSPTATATGPTTATASVTTDDGNGTLNFLASTNATETASTVKAALSQAVTTSGEQSISLEGLDPETTYYVHFVQINGASLESEDVVSTAAFTTPAITYPVLSGASGAATGSFSVSGSVTTDTAGGTIYAALTTSATPPSAEDIVASPTDAATVTDVGEYSVSADSLSSSTLYYWHFIHVDADDLPSNIASASVRTNEYVQYGDPVAFDGAFPDDPLVQNGSAATVLRVWRVS